MRLSLGLIAATALLPACDAGPENPPPNVLIVVIDTTRGDRMGFNGYARPTTPMLDAFAANSVVYTDAWSPSPWTPPSHASLFSGLRPENHGLMFDRSRTVRPGTPMLARLLQDAGYRTGAFVENPTLGPMTQLVSDFEHVELPDWPRLSRPPGGDTATATLQSCAEFIDDSTAAGRPFFAFVNLFGPHAPYDPPESFARSFVGDARRDLVSWGRESWTPNTLAYNLGRIDLAPERLRVLSDLYDAEIATVDAALGSMLTRLRRSGTLDDTLVVITSDHGENLGENGLLEHMFSANRTLLHLPLIVRWPAQARRSGGDPGQVVSATVRLEDVLPTVLEATGVVAPEALDGASLTEVEGQRLARAVSERPRDLLTHISRTYSGTDARRLDHELTSVYDGRWHYIRSSSGEEWLYDVVADPREAQNLAADRPDERERLAALLADG